MECRYHVLCKTCSCSFASSFCSECLCITVKAVCLFELFCYFFLAENSHFYFTSLYIFSAENCVEGWRKLSLVLICCQHTCSIAAKGIGHKNYYLNNIDPRVYLIYIYVCVFFHFLLVSIPNLHNINYVPCTEDFRNKNRLPIVYP